MKNRFRICKGITERFAGWILKLDKLSSSIENRDNLWPRFVVE